MDKTNIMTDRWTVIYTRSHHAFTKAKGPAFFEASGGDSMKVTFPKVTSSNGLRRAIINFMVWEGHHLEATNTMGRPVQKFVPKFSIMTGKVEQVPGRIEWQKGSGTTGSSDAKGHLNMLGRDYAIPLYVEIKYGKDKQSGDQIEYEEKINNSGGIYIIAKTIEGFFEWYFNFLNSYSKT